MTRFVKALKSRKSEIEDWDELRNTLSKHRVNLAYLFGSHAKGETTSLSDMDIAVMFDSDADGRMEPLRLDLMGLLGEEAIDLIDLKSAPPRLKYNVIKEGRVILGEDRSSEFEVRAMKEYFDFKPMEEMYFEGMKKRIEEGKFGK